MQKKKGWGPVQVYIEAQKAGWHLEAFGDKLDDDVKQALTDRGLLSGAGVSGIETSQSGRVNEPPSPADSPRAEAPINSPVSIDELIDAVNKEQSREESK
jgi:hypothetical protein